MRFLNCAELVGMMASSFSGLDCTRLVERYSADLYAFLVGMVTNPESARELLQETFVATWQAAQRGTVPLVSQASDDERRRWLFQVAYHRAMSSLRHQRLIQWESLDADSSSLDDLIESPFEVRLVENDALRHALAELKPLDVACLVLVVVQDFTLQETAAILETTPHAIAKRVQRAKQRLLAIYLSHNTANMRD